MTATMAPERATLLRLCANPDVGLEGPLAAQMERCDAGRLVELAKQTRTAPLLARLLKHAGPDLTACQLEIAEKTADAPRRHALHALGQARAAVRATRLLRDNGIEALALKGVALAFRHYPEPQLRPMRDIDLLLRPDQVQAAQRLLLRAPGYRQPEWAGRYGIEYGHQLPEIEDRENHTLIELHHRINARGWKQEPQFVEALWNDTEALDLLGERVAVPSVRANLLHLVEHATLHHGFSNGPLVLADLHYLCHQRDLEWERIWREAQQLGLARGFALVLALAHEFGACWPPRELVVEAEDGRRFAAQAIEALFAPRDAVERHEQLRRLANGSARGPGAWSAMGRILRPNRHQLARLSGHDPGSLLRWLGYPAWLGEKGRRYLRSRSDRAFMAAHRRRNAMLNWLAGHDQGPTQR